MDNKTIFREKSIERLSSPEKLNDYVRLSNPGVWFILSSVLIILAGFIIFGVFGHIDSWVPGVGISRNGKMVCLVKKEYGERFSQDMKVEIDGERYNVSLRSPRPATVWETTDSYALFIGDMQPGEWVYEIDVDGDFADGSYEAKLITERISPISFILGPSKA